MKAKDLGQYCFLTPSEDGGKTAEELNNKNLWQGLKENTTAHGIPHMSHARGPVKKVFWGILVFGCFSALVIHITIIAIQYGSYRVSVNVQISHERELAFPAVTLCNMNPLKKSSLTKLQTEIPATLFNTGSSRKKRSTKHSKMPSKTMEYTSKNIKEYVCDLVSVLDLEKLSYCQQQRKGKAIPRHYKGSKSMGKHSRKKRAAQTCDVNVNVEPISGDCVTFYDESATYQMSTGQSLCSSAGFNMAKIDTQEKVDFIIAQGLLDPVSDDLTGIGLRDLGAGFEWTDGDPEVYENYGKGHPGTQDCVAIDRSKAKGDWEGVDCTASHFILCTKHIGFNQTRCQSSCIDPVDGICYFILHDTFKLTHDVGIQGCQNYGGQLAVVNTAAKADFVKNCGALSALSSTDLYHIGLSDTGSWTWSNGDPLVFDKWLVGEPANGKDCAAAENTANHNWTGVDCDKDDYHVLCEIQKTVTTEAATTTIEITTETTTLEAPTTEVTTEAPTTTTIATTTTEATTEAPTTTTIATTTTEATTEAPTTTTIATTTTEATTEAPTTTTIATTTKEATTEAPTTTNIATTTTEAPTTTILSTTVAPTTTVETTTDGTTEQTTNTPSTSSTTTTTPTTPLWIGSTTTAPMAIPSSGTPIEGSSFPERIKNRPQFDKQEKVLEVLSNMPIDMKEQLSYSLDEFIVDCQYQGHSCFLSQFEHMYNNLHGNCYIFNSGWNASNPVVRTYRSGRRHGLHIILNIDQDNYVKLGKEAGARVVISPQGHMPFPEDEGYIVPPGLAASIGVTELVIERKSHPYSNCIHDDITHSRDAYMEHYPITYNIKGCYKTCYQKYLIELCNCTDTLIPISGAAFSVDNLPACNISDIKQDDCRYNISNLYSHNKLECDCPVSCSDRAYSPRTSYGQWPSLANKNDTLEDLGPTVEHLWTDPDDPQKYRDNLLKVEVYFEEFNREFIRDLPAYDLGSFASDLGGVIGLWIGFSILTLFEFVEFVMDVIVLFCLKPVTGGKKHNTGKTERGSSNNASSMQNNYSSDYKTDTEVFKKRLKPVNLGGAVNVTHGGAPALTKQIHPLLRV